MLRLLRKLALSGSLLLLLLALGEVGARIWLARFAETEAFLRYASYDQYKARFEFDNPRHVGHWYLGYCGTPDFRDDRGKRGLNRHNVLGFRGDELDVPKPDGRFRIACLGGSTTYTSEVHDYQSSYPYLLGEELRGRGVDVDVVNAGLAGWSSWETLLNFELRVLDLEPDLIVVYHAVNDFHNRFVWPPEAYRPDNSGRHPAPHTAVFFPPAYEQSTLVRMFLVRTGAVLPHKDRVADLLVPAPTWAAGQYINQWKGGTYPSGIFEEVRPEEMLAANPPVYFRRNIESLVALAQAHGVEVVLATFAHSPLFPQHSWSACELHHEGYREHNAITAEIAAERGAHLFDFAAAFPPDERNYADGIHVNRRGARLKAKLFADYLSAEGLVHRD